MAKRDRTPSAPYMSLRQTFPVCLSDLDINLDADIGVSANIFSCGCPRCVSRVHDVFLLVDDGRDPYPYGKRHVEQGRQKDDAVSSEKLEGQIRGLRCI